MRVWLIQVAEPLPIDAGNPRLMRTGLLADHLACAGHDVVWWTSAWDHAGRRARPSGPTTIPVTDKLEIVALPSLGYGRAVSIRRFADQCFLAHGFTRRTRDTALRPDVMVSSLPPLETSWAAVRVGKRLGIPVVIDVRDPYPDTYLRALPGSMRRLATPLLAPFNAVARSVLRDATAVTAISTSFLDWAGRLSGRPGSTRDAVIPLGYEEAPVVTDDDLEAAKSRLAERGVDITGRRRIFWYVGAFGRIIDLGTVVEAVRQLTPEVRSKVQIVLSGDGDLRRSWQDQADGLSGVCFTGWIDKAEIEVLRRLACAGLAAYRHDVEPTLRNKHFEYMSAGLPILSSLGGEVAELLRRERCGITYSGASELSSALVTLVADPMWRHEMGAAAVRVFKERFTVAHSNAAMTDLLLRTVSASAGRSRSGVSSGLPR